MTEENKTRTTNAVLRWAVVFAVAAVALFGSYSFAVARSGAAKAAASGPRTASAAAVPAAAGATDPSAGAASAGCACCGGAAAQGPATTAQAEVSGDVQKISVDVSKGYYDPSTIELRAGVPAEITFSAGSGCTGQVRSSDLGFSADLTRGPATVKLPALTSGTYGFACGMNMVFGEIVVK